MYEKTNNFCCVVGLVAGYEGHERCQVDFGGLALVQWNRFRFVSGGRDSVAGLFQGEFLVEVFNLTNRVLLQMKAAISTELKIAGLQPTDITFLKIIQVYETKNSRHSTMIVGETGSGKSTTWRTLRSALTRLHKEHEDENRRERKDTPNPWTKVHVRNETA